MRWGGVAYPTFSYSFWVCEKSDGVRVLLFVQTDLTTSDQAVYFVSRSTFLLITFTDAEETPQPAGRSTATTPTANCQVSSFRTMKTLGSRYATALSMGSLSLTLILAQSKCVTLGLGLTVCLLVLIVSSIILTGDFAIPGVRLFSGGRLKRDGETLGQTVWGEWFVMSIISNCQA